MRELIAALDDYADTSQRLATAEPDNSKRQYKLGMAAAFRECAGMVLAEAQGHGFGPALPGFDTLRLP